MFYLKPIDSFLPVAVAILVCGFSAPVQARSETAAGLPPAVCADTEASTNLPFRAGLGSAGRFAFTLSCRTTPSNNVEVAFGSDANANGVLDLEETDRVVGWDCGSWFTRQNADGTFVRATTASTNGTQTLSWQMQVGVDGTPSRLFATSGDADIFTGLPLDSAYSRFWDTVRLTGRGLDAALENFSVSVTPDGTAIIMR